MLPLLGAAKVASTLAPLAAGLFHHRPRTPNIQGIIQRYRNEGPSAYLSPEDRAAAARTRTEVSGSAARAAQIQRAEQGRQILARNLQGPAAAALADEATATEAQGREQGATEEANQLYTTGKEKQNTLFGAELGAANTAAQRADSQDQTFWNSMIDLAGATSSLWGTPATPNVMAPAGGPKPGIPGMLPPAGTIPGAPGPLKPGQGPSSGSGLAPYRPPLAPAPTFKPRITNPGASF
jgi:hypothetical protein